MAEILTNERLKDMESMARMMNDKPVLELIATIKALYDDNIGLIKSKSIFANRCEEHEATIEHKDKVIKFIMNYVDPQNCNFCTVDRDSCSGQDCKGIFIKWAEKEAEKDD